MKRFINNEVLKLTKDIRFIAKDIAPNDESGLFSAPSLVVWNGASDNTIFEDKLVNWSFRAFHDVAHLKTGLLFNPAHEMELGAHTSVENDQRLDALACSNYDQNLITEIEQLIKTARGEK